MPVVIQGAEKDEIVAVGNKVDSAGLRSTLTKKAGSAILMSVGEAKGSEPEEKKEEEEKAEVAAKSETTMSALSADSSNSI